MFSGQGLVSLLQSYFDVSFPQNLVPVHKRDKASDVSPLWTFIAQNSKRSGSLSWNFHGLHGSGQSGPLQGLFVFPHLQVLTEMSLSSFEGEKKSSALKSV